MTESPDLPGTTWHRYTGQGHYLGVLPESTGRTPFFDPDDDMKRRAEERAAERG